MSKLANMSIDLQNARDLAEKFPTTKSIKLHLGQCSRLREKVQETLNFAENEERSRRFPAQYNRVFRELFQMVHRVKCFIDDCCYKSGSDFVLAAIKVAAHKERFTKYCLGLNWCVFLIGCIRDTKELSVTSEYLEGFEWKKNGEILVEETRSFVEEDFSNFKEMLRQHVQKPGEHQRICATLLRRFEAEAAPLYGLHLGVPPISAWKLGGRRVKIGKGGFGKVYDFKWKNTVFAIKEPTPGAKPLDEEVCILEKCCHPNIVSSILFLKMPDGEQFLMMEKLSMNLLKYLNERAGGSPVPPLEAVDMILQVCEGMEYLSDIHHVSHRDMKPENILVSERDGLVLELQVADFGLAKVREEIGKSSNQTPNVGTTRYRAPELTVAPGEGNIRARSLKADMFSFAVTCSCILTGVEPYEDILDSVGLEGFRKFVKNGGRPRLPIKCPPGLSSLLEECWDPEPSKRPASFFEICEKLRKVKALLLTCYVHEGDQLRSNSDGSASSQEIGRARFEPGVRPLRILVLGNPDVVKATCRSIGGPSSYSRQGRIVVEESVRLSPPVCLYRDDTTSSADFVDIMSVVTVRNKRWHGVSLKHAWKDYLHFPSDATPFPNRSSRLHMVWYVCTKLSELPNLLQWDYITKNLTGLPVIILVTKTNDFEAILLRKDYFSGNGQGVEDLMINVDLRDALHMTRLWQTCWEVKTKAEIRNAAKIIGYVREQLGSRGIVIPVGIAATRSRAFSVVQSKDFIVRFLCSYWDVPQSFVSVLPSQTNPQEATKFVPFCLQDAAAILYREREHIRGLVPAEVSSDFAFGQARACAEAYFAHLDFDACDKMKSGDIQGFLETVFEGSQRRDDSVRELDRSWSLPKLFGRLRGKGHGP